MRAHAAMRRIHKTTARRHIVLRGLMPGVVFMRTDIEERAIRLAEYITENSVTVRAAAKKFGVSKSTVHTAVT